MRGTKIAQNRGTNANLSCRLDIGHSLGGVKKALGTTSRQAGSLGRRIESESKKGPRTNRQAREGKVDKSAEDRKGEKEETQNYSWIVKRESKENITKGFRNPGIARHQRVKAKA